MRGGANKGVHFQRGLQQAMLSHCGGTQFIRAPRSASGARFDGNYWPDKVFSIVNGIATDNSYSCFISV